MADRFIARLYGQVQAHQAILQAWEHVKPLVCAGHRLVLEVRPETRSDLQNNWIHAAFGDVARQAEWMNRRLALLQWKTLFVSGHSMATGLGADVVPGLEGEFVNIRESTAQMSKARCASLQTYMQAWCADHGVLLRDARQWQIDETTGEIS